MSQRFLIIAGLIFAAAISRLIPHPYNFAPIGAMSLFGAAYFSDKKFSFLIPLVAMFVSDLLINNIIYAGYYQSFTIFTPGFYWIYGAIALIVLAGIFLFRRVSFPAILGGSLAASVIFFVVTNFGVWAGSSVYPPTFAGLILCYEAAIPFFHNTLLGDMFYASVLFGGFEYARAKYPALRAAT